MVPVKLPGGSTVFFSSSCCMGAEPRYVPAGGAIVEVSNRTLQGRFLLRPSPEVNDIVLGILGRAQRKLNLDIFAFQFLSDHFHLLCYAEHAQQLASFMEYFDGNLGRELSRLSERDPSRSERGNRTRLM